MQVASGFNISLRLTHGITCWRRGIEKHLDKQSVNKIEKMLWTAVQSLIFSPQAETDLVDE